MDGELERIRRAVVSRGGRTERLSDELSGAIGRYVREERGRDVTWKALAEALGLSVTTLRRVLSGDATRGKGVLVPVRVRSGDVAEAVRAEPPSGPVIVTPSGLRVEGLSVAEAAELLRLVG